MHFSFSDTLTASDVKRHIPHHFEVPDLAERLTIRLNFDPLSVDGIRNMLTLTLFDPEGFRGAGHRGGNEHEVVITYDKATPGYREGWLPSGMWTAWIDTHMVLPGASCRYELLIDAEEREVLPELDTEEVLDTNMVPSDASGHDEVLEEVAVLQAVPEPIVADSMVFEPPRFDTVVNPNPGWFRGDLHSHTEHSDADWTVFELVAFAHSYGLDFVTLTDHNTVSGLADIEQFSGFDALLTMGGQELTTFWGHAVCLGAHEWIDWRTTQNGEEMSAIAERLDAEDQIFIIAHPKDLGDPYCTGCRWCYPKLMPGPARFVEVWNGPWRSGHGQVDTKNEEGLALWYEWLNAGHRLVATAGSDAHRSEDYAKKPAFNVIYAEELSRQGLFDGLRRGHLYLSSGPNLGIAAGEEDGDGGKMGDTVLISSQTAVVTVGALWAKAPSGARIRLIADGEELELLAIDEEGSVDWSVSVQDMNWCLLEMRDKNGDMLALTNPIFFENAAQNDK